MKKLPVKLLALIMVLAVVFSLAACSGGDEDETTTEPVITAKTPVKKGTVEALKYFNEVMQNVKDTKPKLKFETSSDIKDAKCENSKLFEQSIGTLKKLMLSNPSKETKYGDDLTDVFPMQGESWGSRLTYSDVKYAICTEEKASYTIVILFNSESEPSNYDTAHGKAFKIPDRAEIETELKKAESYMTYGDVGVTYRDCEIKCTIDKQTDQITRLEYKKYVDITTEITGRGTLASMGSSPLTFTYYRSYVFKDFDWTDPNASTTTAPAG